MASCNNRIDIVTNYNHPYTEWCKEEERQINEWAEKFRTENVGDMVGEVIRWPVADGYAQYMVRKQKPLQVVHVNVGDGYQVDPIMIRGLRLSDVRKMVQREREIRKIFS